MLLLLSILASGPAVSVTPPSLAAAKEPQVAIAADHTVYVAYGTGEGVYVSRSLKDASGFEPPVKVAELPKIALGMRRGPRIVVSMGVVTVTAISHRTGNVVSFRSTDRGRTWLPPVTVNDAAGSAREGLHAMAAALEGTVACAWLDVRGKGHRLYMVVSKDAGASWSDDRLVYASPSGTVCECGHPSLAFDPKGKLYVMFRNSLEGARDMYLTSSADLKAFTPAAKLGKGTWMLQACPMDGGMLAVDARGNVHAAWQRNRIVQTSGASGVEQGLGEGTQPWIASGMAGTYLAWQNGRDIIFAPPGSNPNRVSRKGNDPVVASSPDGRLVIGAWTEDGIRAVRLTGN